MTLLRSTARAALRAVPFALGFLILRRSNRQHSERYVCLERAVRAAMAQAEHDRLYVGRIVAAVATTSGDLMDVQDRLNRIAQAAV